MPDVMATPQIQDALNSSIFGMIEGYQKDRKRRQRLYWDYYLGRHYFNVSNERGQPLYGVGKKRIVKNYCKYIVDESVSALFGNSINIVSMAENAEEKGAIETALKKVWISRTGKRKLLQIGRMGGVSGGCFIKFWFDAETKRIVPNVLDTEWVTPVFGDPNNIDKMTGTIIDFVTTDAKGKPVRRTEIVTAEYSRIYEQNKMIEEIENKYAIMPITYIKNLEIPNSFDGLSDIEAAYKVNDEINYSTSDRGSALYYHGNPILAIINAGVKELEVSADRVLILPDEKADAKYIKRDTDFTALNEHIDDLRQTLLKIARLPDDKAMQIGSSNISGVALLMLQAPLVKLISDKQIFYGEGLEAANEIILTMLEIEGMLKTPSTKETEVVFPSYLPADEKMAADTKKVRIDTFAALINNGILSKETAMKQMMDEGLINIASVEDELKALDEEKATESNSLFPDTFKDKGGDQSNMMDGENNSVSGMNKGIKGDQNNGG